MAICSSLKEFLDKGTTSARKLCYELAEEKVGAHGEAPCEKPNTRTIFEDDVYSFIIGGVCNGKIEAIGEDCPHTLKNKLDQFIQAKEAFDYQLSRVKTGRGTSKTALLYCTPSEISPLQEAFYRKDIEDDFVRARDALDDIVYSLDLRVIPLQAVRYIAQNERVREKYLSKALMEYLAHGQDVTINSVQEKLESDNLYIFLKYEKCLQKYEQQHYARKNDALSTIIRNYLHHLDKDTAIRAQIPETTENKKVSRGESSERNLSRDYKDAPAKIEELRKIFPDLPPLPIKK